MNDRTVADEVRQHLHEYIVTENLPEGDALPSARELARRCGASLGTISSVLGTLKEEGKISLRPGRRALLLDVGKTRHDYVRFLENKAIRARTHALECVIHISSDLGHDPYMSGVFSGIREAAEAAGYRLALASNLEGSVSEPKKLKRVDGVLVSAPKESSRPHILALKRRKVPFVLINNRFQGLKASYVMADSFGGARKAVQHLFDLGHRRIGLVAGPYGTISEVERLAGYRDALALNGIEYDPRLVLFTKDGNPDPDVLFRTENPPTALFFMNFPIACNVIRNLKNLGMRVPEDVSVVGYDDFFGAEFMHPPLTTIRQPLREIGRQAVEGLIALIIGKAESVEKVLEPELVVRESTERV